MNMQKFSIGLILGIAVAAVVWFAFTQSHERQPVVPEAPAIVGTPTAAPDMTSGGYGPKTPPYVVPPTTPPPGR